MPAAPQITTYFFPIRTDVRIRVHITAGEHGIETFAITLEVEIVEGDWRAAVRYDNTGGTIRRDRFDLEGSYIEHRNPMRAGLDPNAAVVHLREELAERCDEYVSLFRASGP